jgi:hypothetical protein
MTALITLTCFRRMPSSHLHVPVLVSAGKCTTRLLAMSSHSHVFRNAFNSDKVAEISYASNSSSQSTFYFNLSIYQLFKARIASSRSSVIRLSCWNVLLSVQRFAMAMLSLLLILMRSSYSSLEMAQTLERRNRSPHLITRQR